jgi:hypothetical protein
MSSSLRCFQQNIEFRKNALTYNQISDPDWLHFYSLIISFHALSDEVRLRCACLRVDLE